MRNCRALPLLSLAVTLASGCAGTAQPYAREVDENLPWSSTGIVRVADAPNGATIIAVNGAGVDCPHGCQAGLRLPAGSQQLSLALSRYDASLAAMQPATTTLDLLVEARHVYRIRRIGSEREHSFGVEDLGESVDR